MNPIQHCVALAKSAGNGWRALCGTVGLATGLAAQAATLYITAVHPDDALMQGSIHAFQIGPDGSLSPLQGQPVHAGAAPFDLRVVPSTPQRAATVLVTDACAVWQYAVSPEHGLHWLGDASTRVLPDTCPGDLVLGPGARYVYMSSPNSGDILSWPLDALGLIGPPPPQRTATGGCPERMALADDGAGNAQLYVASRDDGGALHAYVLNPTTGQLVESPGSPVPSFSPTPSALLLHRHATTQHNGQQLPGPVVDAYLANADPAGIIHLRLRSTGPISLSDAQTHGMPLEPGPLALALDPRACFLYASSARGRLLRFAIDPGNGHLASGEIALDVGEDGALVSAAAHRTLAGMDMLLVLDSAARQVKSYRIEHDGRLAELGTTPLAPGSVPIGMAIAEP